MVIFQRILVSRTIYKKALLTNMVNNFRAMTTENDVIFEECNNVGVITLNRPKVLNSLNLSMVLKLKPVISKWQSEKDLVLIKGAGDKAFCAGGDVKAIVEAGLKGDNLGQEFFKHEYTLNGIIGNYKILYVALIDGIVMGGGVGLSVHGHYRVATERTLFAMPETAIGLFADVGGSYFLPRLTGKLGTYLALTGKRLKGADVYRAGIATHFCLSNQIKDLEKELIYKDENQNTIAILNKYHKCDVPEFSLKSNMEQINRCFAFDTIECIIKELENDGSHWGRDTINALMQMSPTSLKLVLKQLNVGQHMNLLDCLEMEYRLAMACLANKDFYEGVRALLIDKDQQPCWNPTSLAKVTDEMIDGYFKKLPEEQELRHKL